MMQHKTINGYTLKYKLGEGGIAEVWQAENKLGKKAAVKILLPALALKPKMISRFENEAKAMLILEHPNIRQVYDFDYIENRLCIIMEYLEGGNLSHWMKQGERFSSAQCRNWWNQLVEALNYTHKHGIVHRDIKPSNIFLCDNGNVKLLDFGIAKIRDSVTITQTGSSGTLMYMSPEQVKNSKNLDHRSDFYSLAVTFYHLLTGAAPYDNTKSADSKIRNKIVSEPLHLDLLPKEWYTFLLPYLSKDPDDRPELIGFNTKISNQKSEEGTVIITPKAAEPKPDKYTETIKKVSFEMVSIPAGTFIMGSPSSEVYRSEDETQHLVTLSSYYMGATEVTKELWKAVMGSNLGYFLGDNLPVVQVSWDDCQTFIRKLNRLTGKTYRLPTEAEWEYACRAGTTTSFNTGHKLTKTQANYENFNTTPVYNFPPNAWGLYDMHGNVWEWCSDWYGDYPTSAQTNPKGPSRGSKRVNRGGSWHYFARHCRSANRSCFAPEFHSYNLGFRIVSSK